MADIFCFLKKNNIYKTKEAENVIYRSLLHSYYKNITPKDGTETF